MKWAAILPVWLALAALASAVETISPEEITPGMHGKVRTVMQGTEIVDLDVELFGVMKGALGPGRDLIIGRLTDERTKVTGAVHGMSGSPLYINGKLAGALSRRLMMFEKDGHCGFTPIRDMFDVQKRPVEPSGAEYWTSGKSWDPRSWFGKASTPAEAGEFLSLPLGITGWKQSWSAAMKTLMDGLPGLTPVPMGSIPASGARVASTGEDKNFPFEAGSPLSVVLMDGDITSAATGTLTWKEGNKFMGFGHPMVGWGDVAFPVAPAEIITVVPSYLTPFKMAQPGPVNGTLQQDRLSAVAGVEGLMPDMASYEVSRSHDGEKLAPYSGRFVRDPRFAPLMSLILFANSVFDEQNYSFNSTIDLQATVELEGLPPIRLGGVFSGDDTAGMEALSDTLIPLFQLFHEFPEQMKYKSLRINVASYESASRWQIGEIQVREKEPRPGDTLHIMVRLRNAKGTTEWVKAEMKLPEEIKNGSFFVRALAGSDLESSERQKLYFTRPESPRDWLFALGKSYWHDAVYFQIVTDGRAVYTQGRMQASLPPSIYQSIQSQITDRRMDELNQDVHAELPVSWPGVVEGSAIVEIPVQ